MTKTPTTVTTPGTYTLNVVDPRANCANSTGFVVTIDTARPQVQLDNPLELTCDRTQVNIDGNKSDKRSDLCTDMDRPRTGCRRIKLSGYRECHQIYSDG
ncbi:MAG: hypothetical protein U0T81_01130 [Saprospiraceae bacterium]